ncbi:MAG: hypothetical protein WD672_04430 [Woeseia sp.]
MKYAFLIILALASISLLSACGGTASDHGHPHDEASPATHAAERSAADDVEYGHGLGDDTHSHDAPETEAFYGDDATNASENAVVDDNGHAHGEDTHTHDGDQDGPDTTTEHGEDTESGEPHGHDH